MPYYSGEPPADDGPLPRRAMAIVAHPDDADFTVAGTVARWARAGAACIYVLCTDGNKGSDDPAMTPERLAPIRRTERPIMRGSVSTPICGSISTAPSSGAGTWTRPWRRSVRRSFIPRTLRAWASRYLNNPQRPVPYRR